MKIEYKVDFNKIQEVAKMRQIDLNNYSKDEIIRKANENEKSIEKEWNEKEEELINILNEILPSLDNNYIIKIYIFPKEVPVGACNCETKEILFGYKKEYKYFNLVTICHEITHILIYKYRKRNIISRITDETIAFLVAECEIRKRLTGEKYFSNFFSGELSDLHYKAVYTASENLTIWNDYLQDKEKNIKKLLQNIEKNVSKIEKEKYKEVKLRDFLN